MSEATKEDRDQAAIMIAKAFIEEMPASRAVTFVERLLNQLPQSCEEPIELLCKALAILYKAKESWEEVMKQRLML